MQRSIWILILVFMILTVDAKIGPEHQATIRQIEQFSEAFSAIASEVNSGVVTIINNQFTITPCLSLGF